MCVAGGRQPHAGGGGGGGASAAGTVRNLPPGLGDLFGGGMPKLRGNLSQSNLMLYNVTKSAPLLSSLIQSSMKWFEAVGNLVMYAAVLFL